jgi:iron complex outermembrane recepter protein
MTHSKMKQLPAALISALGKGAAVTLLASPFALAQQTPPAQPAKIEKIEVTGSNIKRVDTETISPVQIITREEIQATGKNTIAEVLRDLPINSGNAFNEQFTNSFSPGASGVSLRGLGQKNTLTLVNGRRQASYGFAQNLQDTYVDLNSIPTSAVERIEILRAGASHIYGSDAIAGVVNVILRKDYTGIEISGTAGTSTEGGANEYRTNLSAGFGDLAKDRFNALVSVDYFKRDQLLASERDYTRELDFRQYAAGDLIRSTLATYFPFGASAAAPNPNRVAFPGCTGEVLTPQQINVFSTLRGTTCVYNQAPYRTLFPRSERLGAISRGTFDVSGTLQLFAEAGYSKNKTFQTFTPGFINTANVAFNAQTGGVSTILGILPANSPYAYRFNGAPVASQFVYTFTELGGRNAEIESDSTRFLVGAKGSLGKWDWEAAGTVARNEVTQTNLNGVNRFAVERILAGTLNYNFFNRNDPANAAAVNELRLKPFDRKAKSDLQAFDAKVSTELGQFGAGPVGLAFGVETRKEKIKDTPSQTLLGGFVLGQGATATDGERRNTAVFGEVNVQPVKGVEIQTAVRHERYSDFGNTTVPGVGLKWTITPNFALRGNYSRGFRAPSLPENSRSNATFFVTVFDPVQGVNVNTAGIFQSNAGLGPEKSKNYNIGAVWDPTKDTSVLLDFYGIEQRDIVASNSFNFIVANPGLFPGQVVRDPISGNLVSVTSKFINLALTETSGFDFEARHRMSLGEMGKLTFAANYSYIISFKQTAAAGLDPTEGVDSNTNGSIPRYRGVLSATWERGDWLVRLANRHQEGYEQAFTTPLPQQTKIGSRDYQDLFIRYNGIKNLSLTASVTNLLDTQPPYDGSAGLRYDNTQYDLRGRYINIGASYKFK